MSSSSAPELANNSSLAVDAVEESLAESSVENLSDIIICSTGVRFKVKGVSLGVLQDLTKKYGKTKPKVPMVKLEHKGRVEPNPDDPDYIEAKQSWEQDFLMAQMDALLMLGTSVHSIPDGLPEIDDESWVEEYEILGLEIDKRKSGRYLSWIKYIGAPSPRDYQLLSQAIAMKTGVSEDQVADAIDRFRD